MEAQGQNKIVDISKYVTHNCVCYINPNYITKIYKSKYDANFQLVVGESIISLFL